MLDLSHQYGSDLAVSPTGDLAIVSGTLLGQQRILRRLLTGPGDYIWNPDYGAGLASCIGGPVNLLQIQALVRSQIFKESTIARTPEPVIEVQASPQGPAGAVYVDIRYVDAPTGQTQVLSFSAST